jgi:cytochrome c oxidase cbb3-type subunit III
MTEAITETTMADHNPFPGENNTGHIWDDNIRELSNPPPRWWMIAFWASVAWWAAYGLLYPMWPSLTGYTKGFTGWTQMQEYKQGVADIDGIRAKYETRIAAMQPKAILADADAKQYAQASAKVLFGDYCAACHGSGGQGNIGFPVLADDDWLYGGMVEAIVETVSNGRKGMMTAHAKVLKPVETELLVKYVVGLSQGKADADGQKLFMDKGCFACHGPDGKGMQAMGSANLTDGIWRFRPSEGQTQADSVRHTILHGVNDPSDPMTREAVMPVFKDRLALARWFSQVA